MCITWTLTIRRSWECPERELDMKNIDSDSLVFLFTPCLEDALFMDQMYNTRTLSGLINLLSHLMTFNLFIVTL